jgi:hypothetical protein
MFLRVIKRLSSNMKRKASTEEVLTTKKAKNEDFLEEVQKNRVKTAESVLNFKINKKRVQILNNYEQVPETNNEGGICYWMARDQRYVMFMTI